MKHVINGLQENLSTKAIPRISVRHFSRILGGYITNGSIYKPHPEIIQETYNGDILYENARCSATHKVPTKAIMDKYNLSNIRTNYEIGMDIVGKKPQHIVHYDEYNNAESLQKFKEDVKLTAYLSAECRSAVIKNNMAALRAQDRHVEDTKLLEVSQKQFEAFQERLNKTKIDDMDV